MKKQTLLATLVGIFIVSQTASAEISQNVYKYGSFGPVTVYQSGDSPERLVLFASGDGGWNQGVVDMAKAMVDGKTVVAGFNTVAFMNHLDASKSSCIYPAGDLELLSKYLQAKLNFKEYSQPLLVGYSSGATLAYGALVQAPEATFQGAVSLGFCSDLENKKPLCKGFGLAHQVLKKGFDYSPAKRRLPNWTVLHGDIDQVCSLEKTRDFIAKTPDASLVKLTKVGHGFSVQNRWMKDFKESVQKILAINGEVKQDVKSNFEGKTISNETVKDLPLVEMNTRSNNVDSKKFVVFLSGDGGWAGFDQQVSQEFLNDGMPVVGLNSLKYFWNKKTPETGSRDLGRIIAHYAEKLGKDTVTIVGFSFGADVVPFFVSRLPKEMKAKIKKLVLLAPAKKAEFEFHFTDWIVSSDKGTPLAPEVESLSTQMEVICVYGSSDESESGCPSLKKAGASVHSLPGGHHFDATTSELYNLIK